MPAGATHWKCALLALCTIEAATGITNDKYGCSDRDRRRRGIVRKKTPPNRSPSAFCTILNQGHLASCDLMQPAESHHHSRPPRVPARCKRHEQKEKETPSGFQCTLVERVRSSRHASDDGTYCLTSHTHR